MDNLPEERFLELIGKPEIGQVRRQDGKTIKPGMGIPQYIVQPALHRMRTPLWNSTQTIKIIDFGESFLRTTFPQTLHTPLPVRAPEVLFKDRIDYRVDLWSIGCMVSKATQDEALYYLKVN